MFNCVAFLLIGLSPLAGCARAVQANTPATIGASDYEPAFAATVEVLRDHGYRIARNDYRFGVISTYPKESPTVAEPWVGDNTSTDQAWRGTLNAERRVVTVRFQHVDGAMAEATEPGDYGIWIEVELQRRREPSRYLTHSASGYISSQYAAVPTHLRQRGIEGDSWEAVKQDTDLERRLAAAVLNQLSQTTDTTGTTGNADVAGNAEHTGRSAPPASQQ